MKREIPWVDPITQELFVVNDKLISSKSSSYPIVNGIPNFAENISDEIQKQVQESFGEKWTKTTFANDDEKFENILRACVNFKRAQKEKIWADLNDNFK